MGSQCNLNMCVNEEPQALTMSLNNACQAEPCTVDFCCQVGLEGRQADVMVAARPVALDATCQSNCTSQNLGRALALVRELGSPKYRGTLVELFGLIDLSTISGQALSSNGIHLYEFLDELLDIRLG